MADLVSLMRQLDDVVAPDLWTEIERRALAPQPARRHSRRSMAWVAVAGGLVATITAFVMLVPRPSAATAVIQQAIEAYSKLPPFQASLYFDHNPAGEDALGVPQGATSVVEVSFGGSAGFRFETVAAEPEGWHFLAVVGSSVVWDGDQLGTYDARTDDFLSWGPQQGFEPLRELSWNAPYPNWEEVCGRGGSEVLEDTSIAGRAVHHLRCGDWTGGFWELWIDSETGLLLKLVGSLDQDDLRFGTAPSGGFEVTEITYSPDFETDTFSISPPPGMEDGTPTVDGVPSFRAIISELTDASIIGTDNDWVTVKEIWYSVEGSWRIDVLEDTLHPQTPEGAGSFRVWDGDMYGTYNAFDHAFAQEQGDYHCIAPCAVMELSPAFRSWWDGNSTEEFIAKWCTDTGVGDMAGRPAHQFVCEPESSASEIWLDAETGLFLKIAAEDFGLEVVEIEYDPAFPEGIFGFDPPPGSRSYEDLAADPYAQSTLRPGEVAAPWSGQLLDGATFAIEASGRPVMVLFWADWCPLGDPACDVLPQFQEVSVAWFEQVVFVSVDLFGSADEAQRIVETGGYTFPVIVDGDGSISNSWGVQGVPFWVLLDEAGRVIEARAKPQTVEQLEEMLGQVVRP